MYNNSQQTVADTREAPPDYFEATNSLNHQPASAAHWSQSPSFGPPAYSQFGASYGFDNANYKEDSREQPYSITIPPNSSQTFVHPLASQGPLKNYLGIAILTLFLFMPTAIVAIIKANQAQTEYNNGNIARAKESNKSALKYIFISFKIGAMLWTILGFLCTYKFFIYKH